MLEILFKLFLPNDSNINLTDRSAAKTPTKNSVIESAGKDSKIDQTNSCQFSKIIFKSEKSNEKICQVPACVNSSVSDFKATTKKDADAKNEPPSAANLRLTRERFLRSIAVIIRENKPSGGLAGVSPDSNKSALIPFSICLSSCFIPFNTQGTHLLVQTKNRHKPDYLVQLNVAPRRALHIRKHYEMVAKLFRREILDF